MNFRYQHILGYMQRTKQFFQNRSFQADDINKKNEQMLALLAIASTFCPLRLDESVNIQVITKVILFGIQYEIISYGANFYYIRWCKFYKLRFYWISKLIDNIIAD